MRVALALLAATVVAATPARRTYDSHAYYVLEHVPRAGGPSPAECARALGTELVEPAGALQDHWLVRAPHPHKRDGADPVLAAYRALHEPTTPSWLARRSAPDTRIAGAVRYLERQTLRQRVKRASPEVPDGPPQRTSHDVALALAIRDPAFPKQWHLVNDEHPHNSMNVSGVWALGVTGKGVTAALVDDGLDYTSDDLAPNFDAFGSYDYNEHTDLPTPVLPEDHHGTRCAGQIAAVKNDVCGVGMAYDAKIAGLRILSGPISDIDEAASLNHNFGNTSIYSCSWGPPDDGRSMEAPGYLVEKAVVNGINNGRGGLGSIFVFAAGNGGGAGDQCNFDGYTNSIYSITVAAVDYKGLHPPYSEACAANMVVAYTSGSGHQITTTDVGKNACSSSHGGTSAAAPNAVGVFVLALSVKSVHSLVSCSAV
jgi:kexin